MCFFSTILLDAYAYAHQGGDESLNNQGSLVR